MDFCQSGGRGLEVVNIGFDYGEIGGGGLARTGYEVLRVDFGIVGGREIHGFAMTCNVDFRIVGGGGLYVGHFNFIAAEISIVCR